MSSIQLAEFVLWKSIKQKRKDASAQGFPLPNNRFSEEIVFPNEMICIVCTNQADIPITEKINGVHISSALRTVSSVWVSSSASSYPKYLCKTCLEELKVALTFRKKCESSDYLFYQTQSKKPQDHDPQNTTMIMHDFALIINQMKKRRLALLKDADRNQLIQKTFSTYYSQETNSNDTEARPSKPKKCQRCDLTFDSKESLIQHRLQQNCISPPCPLCGKFVSNLSRHKNNVHLKTIKYTCHICGKIKYTSGGLRNHLLVHSDKCDYPCPLCPYKGKQQAYLTLHMRVHTGEKPYLCSECPAKFVNPSNLRKHQLIHSSKKFECKKCNKQFRVLKSLQEHFDAAHLNIRYRCSICGRELWTRRKLLSHELKVHKREKHKLYNEIHKVVLNDEND